MKFNIEDFSGYTTEEEVLSALHKAVGVMKMVCGNVNNAAHYCMLDAYNNIKQHPRYKQQVRQEWKKVWKLYEEYERNLLHRQTFRLFHVDDMPANIRRKFRKNLTDREFFEYWKYCGQTLYANTLPFVLSLQNKLAKSLSRHNEGNVNITAWGLTATYALTVACQVYESAIRQIHKEMGIPYALLDPSMSGENDEHGGLFGQLSLHRVLKAWKRALTMLNPVQSYSLSEAEKQDIGFGISDLEERWSKPDELASSVFKSTEENEEIFDTKGMQQKVLREIVDLGL